MPNKFSEAVWKLCSKIPRGKVTTYKEIATALHTKAYRAVGNSLKNNPFAPTVPCHRVVASDGTLGGYNGRLNSKKKISLLKKEGVRFIDGKIDGFQKKLHKFGP